MMDSGAIIPICYHCDITTLKSLRFVNRAIGDVAARALFQEIYVATLNYPLRNLSCIANHPVLRHFCQSAFLLHAGTG